MTSSGRARLWKISNGVGLGMTVGLLVQGLDLPTLVSWWGDRTWVVLVCAALGGALGALDHRWLLPTLVGPLIVLWALVAFSPLTRWLAADLVRSDAPVSADAVFPLSASLQPDGDLTTVSLSRQLRALELIAQGHTRRLILSELPGEYPRVEPAARELMAALNIDAEVIVVGPVGNTRDEAVAAAALARERGFHRLLLVSSPTHTLRASLTFEAQGIAVTPVAAREPRFDIENLDRPDGRVMAFGPVLHERLGLAWYRWRGYIH